MGLLLGMLAVESLRPPSDLLVNLPGCYMGPAIKHPWCTLGSWCDFLFLFLHRFYLFTQDTIYYRTLYLLHSYRLYTLTRDGVPWRKRKNQRWELVPITQACPDHDAFHSAWIVVFLHVNVVWSLFSYPDNITQWNMYVKFSLAFISSSMSIQ